jgi:polar amino acid transport system substrate-binding protein
VWLKQRLTAAKVRKTPDYTLRDAVQWPRNGDVTAFAGRRQRLSSGTRGVPGLRMLDERLRLVNAALGEMRSSGFLVDSAAHSGIEGLTVAPDDTQEP